MIKIADIDTEKTVWENIADVLKKNGFKVYPPATHKGECTEKYIVLKQDGSSQINGYSSRRVYYRFLLYVPREEYTELTKFEKAVKKVLDEQLYPLIKPSGQTETDYFDDNINGHLRVFLYQNNERDKYL